jgi:hypothetical protein
MTRSIFIIVGLAVLVLARPGVAQQVPGGGFSGLLCLAGIDGNGTYPVDPAGQVTIEVSGDDGSSATFAIMHGQDGSTHFVTYDDRNDNGRIDCGDRVLSVS